jgi:hypothetical protein
MTHVSQTGAVSQAEIEQAVAIIKKLQKGNLPQDIFVAIAEKTVTPIVEIVPVRRNAEGKTEVLLTRRPDNDPIWPGMLHVPGTVVRASDGDLHNSEAFVRITQGELAGTPMGKPVLAYSLLHASERGMEQSQVYWAEVTGQPLSGKFYPADDLPSEVVPSQLDFIPSAVHNYESSQASKA